jgi:hypothetical protein
LHTNHSATSVYDYRDATQIQRLCQDPRFLNSHLSPQAAYECTISRVAGTWVNWIDTRVALCTQHCNFTVGGDSGSPWKSLIEEKSIAALRLTGGIA